MWAKARQNSEKETAYNMHPPGARKSLPGMKTLTEAFYTIILYSPG